VRLSWLRIAIACVCLVLVGCDAVRGSPGSASPDDAPGSAGVSPSIGDASHDPAASPGPRRALLVDTDVAPDDIVALTFLLASPRVELVAITVSGTGEAHCAGGVDVVLRLLDRLAAPDIPVACGREAPLVGTHEFPGLWRQGADAGSALALGPTTRAPSASTAAELIAAQAAEHEALTVLTLGPLTNLADALLRDPELADGLGPVFVMGGAVHVPGNLVCCGAPEDNHVAEWNVYVDPHAAQVVVDSGLMASFVSLDGTNQVPLTPTFARRVIDSADSPAARLVAELFDANPFMTDGASYLWDPLAAEIAAGYPVGSFSPASIVVEEAEGPESGFTRPVDGAPNIRYLTTVDPAAAEDTLLRILRGG